MTRDINMINAIFSIWWVWVAVAVLLIHAARIAFGKDDE